MIEVAVPSSRLTCSMRSSGTSGPASTSIQRWNGGVKSRCRRAAERCTPTGPELSNMRSKAPAPFLPSSRQGMVSSRQERM
jgi:hypothetical protein